VLTGKKRRGEFILDKEKRRGLDQMLKKRRRRKGTRKAFGGEGPWSVSRDKPQEGTRTPEKISGGHPQGEEDT